MRRAREAGPFVARAIVLYYVYFERTVLPHLPAVSSVLSAANITQGRLHEGRPNSGRDLALSPCSSVLSEGHVLLYGPNLGLVNQSGSAESALALGGLLLENVTLTLLATQNLARAGHLETLGNSLTCLVDTTFTSHGAEIILFFFYLASKIIQNQDIFSLFWSIFVNARVNSLLTPFKLEIEA